MTDLIVPPHSVEAEQSLIGALILNNGAFDQVADLVAADDLFRQDHRLIYRSLVRLLEAGKPADIVTIADEMHADLKNTGGQMYLASLMSNTPGAANIRRYAEIVHAKAVQRRLAQAGSEIAERALSASSLDVSRMVEDAEDRISAVSDASARRGEGPKSMNAILGAVIERIDQLYHRDNGSGVTGVPTGFSDLDAKTSGLQPGDLIVIAGRPSMGKTAFALNIVEHVAIDLQLPVVVFSMEMSSEQLTQRLLASRAKVNSHGIRTGRLADEDWGRLTHAIAELNGAPLEIDDGGSLTGAEVRARARRVRRQHGKLGLVVVDYLQLMESSTKGENRATDVAEISRTLKGLAKELACPVVALSQLSREVDKRANRVPILSDLRESGAIEQDADLILFLYRDEVYHPEKPEAKGHAEVIIGKQRNGPIGDIPLAFLGQYTRFENFAGEAYSPRRTTAKVRNFNDFKTRSVGPDGA